MIFIRTLFYLLTLNLALIPLSSLANEEKSGECTVSLFSKLLFFKKVSEINHAQSAIRSSNCSERRLWSLFKIIQNIDGKISSSHINRLLHEEGFTGKILLHPDKIEVFHINKMVASYISSQKSLSVDRVTTTDLVYVAGLNSLAEVQLECHACDSPGVKNLSVIYDSQKSSYKRNIWIRVKLTEIKEVVVAISDIYPFSSKSISELVGIAPLKVEKNELYIKSLSNIEFFTVNKFIKKGYPLKHSDIIAKTLVTAGKVAHVILEQDGLRLQVEAVAKQSGKFGDFVTLFNPKSKKKIRGQVVDFNKVKVEI